MGLFTKSTNDNNELNAFLGVGTEYCGKLEFVGTVRIDGRFEGEISTDGDLILGREACIIGTVQVGRLTSNGHIEGDVSVDERATLEKTSYLKGSLTAPQLVVQEGAVIEGGIMMTKDGSEAKGKLVSGDFSQKPGDTAAVSETDVAKTGSDDTKY